MSKITQPLTWYIYQRELLVGSFGRSHGKLSGESKGLVCCHLLRHMGGARRGRFRGELLLVGTRIGERFGDWILDDAKMEFGHWWMGENRVN